MSTAHQRCSFSNSDFHFRAAIAACFCQAVVKHLQDHSQNANLASLLASKRAWSINEWNVLFLAAYLLIRSALTIAARRMKEFYGVKGLSTPTVLAAQARKQSLKTGCACAPSLNPTRGILGHRRKIASPLRLPRAALNRFPTPFGKN